MAVTDQGSAEAHERRLHDARVQELAADVDLHLSAAVAAGTRAKAMERSSVGENVPLVISPSPTPRTSTFWWLRSTPRSSSSRPTSLRGEPARAHLERASRPMKARPAGSSATVQPSADSRRMRARVHVVAVEVHAGLQAQRVARAEAAGGDAQRIQAAPRRHRIRGRQHDLEAVLAGVAGARDEPCAELAPDESLERERGGGLRRAQQLRRLGARLRALHGEHRQVRALADLDVEGRAWRRIQARSLSRVPAFTTRRNQDSLR